MFKTNSDPTRFILKNESPTITFRRDVPSRLVNQIVRMIAKGQIVIEDSKGNRLNIKET